MKMTLSRESIKRDYKWMTKNFFEKIFREKFNFPELNVTEYDIYPSFQPDQNNENIEVRGNFSVTNCDRNNYYVVMKLICIKPDICTLFEYLIKYEKEVFLYEKILVETHDTLKSIGINEKFGANLISYSKKPTYLMFEDLKELGFKGINRAEALDYDHLKITLTKVAYLHAASACVVGQHPEFRDSVTHNVFYKHEKYFEDGRCLRLYSAGQETKEWAGFEAIGAKLISMSDKISKRGAKVYTTIESDFNVITNGHLVFDNLMFKYDTETNALKDVILDDYSSGFWGSPGIDLGYLLLSSSADNVTEQDWDRLLYHYHSVLKSTLEKLNYSKEIPTAIDIQLMYLKASQFCFYVGIVGASMRHLTSPELFPTINYFSETDTIRRFRVLFQNENYKKTVEKLLEYFDRKGFLD